MQHRLLEALARSLRTRTVLSPQCPKLLSSGSVVSDHLKAASAPPSFQQPWSMPGAAGSIAIKPCDVGEMLSEGLGKRLWDYRWREVLHWRIEISCSGRSWDAQSLKLLLRTYLTSSVELLFYALDCRSTKDDA